MRTALVTGVSRGLGRHVTRFLKEAGYRVIGVGQAAEPGNPHLDDYERVDLGRLDRAPRQAFGHVDVLVNNASVYLDDPRRGYGDVFALTADDLRATWEVNVFAAVLLTQAVAPGMAERGHGRVVNVSSGMGRLRDADGEAFAYRSSKLALNHLTLTIARHLERRDGDLAAFSYCPGWIRTDMGLPSAPSPPEPAARSLVSLLDRAGHTTNGRFFRLDDELGWDLSG